MTKSIHITDELHSKLKEIAIKEKTTARQVLEQMAEYGIHANGFSSLEEMAFSRDGWVNFVRSRLSGAVGEYVKLEISRQLGHKDFWSHEVEGLLKHNLDNFLDPKIKKTKSKFDRVKALKESIDDLEGLTGQVTSAKNDYIKEFTDSANDIRKMKFYDEGHYIKEMFKEFRPELYKKIY